MKLTRPNLEMVWELMHKDLVAPEIIVSSNDEPCQCGFSECFDCEELDYKRHQEDIARREFLSYCRKATRDDYFIWYEGFKLFGGKAKYLRDWAFDSRNDWYVLLSEDVEIPQLYGSDAVNIIIPGRFKNVRYETNAYGWSGHNTVYKLRDYSFIGTGAESFTDVK